MTPLPMSRVPLPAPLLNPLLTVSRELHKRSHPILVWATMFLRVPDLLEWHLRSEDVMFQGWAKQ